MKELKKALAGIITMALIMFLMMAILHICTKVKEFKLLKKTKPVFNLVASSKVMVTS